MRGELNFRDLYLLHMEMRKQAANLSPLVLGGPSYLAARATRGAAKGVGKMGLGIGKRVVKKPLNYLFGGMIGANLASTVGMTAKNMWKAMAQGKKFAPSAHEIAGGTY